MKNWFNGHNRWYVLRLNLKTGDYCRVYYKFKIKLIFKWFDMWVGLFIDQENRIIYFFPVPMIGFKIGFQV